jgi:class 3 adenylate cyclase
VPSERAKNLDDPDQTVEYDHLKIEQVHLGDLTIGRVTAAPGWRWSEHVRPHVGGEWCQARHVGVVLSGYLEVSTPDGSIQRYGPNDVFDIAPVHDGFVPGDEPCVQIDWAGLHMFTDARILGTGETVLATLLFTDLVDSTTRARELGDAQWRQLLSSHFEMARGQLDRFHGREVKTTGDGLLATFEGPAAALRCAARIRAAAAADGLRIRASVHVGEVETVGNDVRGIAVHEAARILGVAGADEILVSELTRALAGSSGLEFRYHGTYELKGLSGARELFEFVEAPGAPA